MQEIFELISNASAITIIIALFSWIIYTDRTKNNNLLEEMKNANINTSKCLEEIKTANINTSKSLEIIQENQRLQKDFLVEHDKRCQSTAENMKIVQQNIAEIKEKMR
jgi:hypothetical protein